ncbi:SWIM zinc finger family protein [Streptomyces sp900105245]|uniref:SWIM zinc finger family protein n=1 Tax=Streptomyces sp. 900105245 TaxID=3154379 RepID=UPI00331ABA94
MTAGGQPRPADAARRALREARERTETERHDTAGSAEDAVRDADAPRDHTGEAAGPHDETAGTAAADGTDALTGTGSCAGPGQGAEPRPGNAVRAALRAAIADRRGDADGRTTAEADEPAGEETPDPEPPATTSAVTAGAAGGQRPGDAAREALRTARREARRAEAAEPGNRRHTARPVTAAPRPASGTARGRTAEDMRNYLANAFRMPAWTEGPEGPEGPGGAEEPEGTPEREAGRETAETEETAPGPGTPADETAPDGTPPAPARSSSPALSPAPDLAPESAPESAVESARESGPAPAAAPTPAVPHAPSTMATPHRDTELRRTFPAFAVRPGAEEGTEFAGTWWGNAWVEALERGALDPKRLARGRGYAEQGHVDAITVTPGLVLAYVRGSRPRPYRAQVRVRTLADDDWTRFLDAAADRPGHIAALLDKELPQSLADCGVPLLPGPGDLAPRCSCPDSGHPCKHAAALCYQMARLLDADPFVLLLLRGRGEKELLDALSRRSAARAARAAQERRPQSLPGVRATDALTPRRLPPLPPPAPVPPHPEQPPVYPAAPGGPDPFALDQLATDAAARAHALLGTGRDPVGELTLWQDAVRLAAARPGSGLTAATRTLYATLATAVGRTTADLARAVAAWRQGGPEGLAVLEEPWDPPAGRFDRARPLLLAADLPAFRPWRNRLTHPRGHVQLRLGRDGLWYAYESEPGQEDWWPRGTPDLDPVGALTGLGTPDDL